MRHRALAVVALSVVVAYTGSARAGDPQKQSDADIKKLAVGKWSWDESHPSGAKAKATITYKKDGTFDGAVVVDLQGHTVRVRLSGTWSVANGMLTETITQSVPAGLPMEKSTDKVLSISKTVLKRKTDKGQVIEQKRVSG